MECREMRDAGERREVEVFVEVAIDIFDHRMQAPLVLGLAAARGRHARDQRPR
jgi:hypothetical protein